MEGVEHTGEELSHESHHHVQGVVQDPYISEHVPRYTNDVQMNMQWQTKAGVRDTIWSPHSRTWRTVDCACGGLLPTSQLQ